MSNSTILREYLMSLGFRVNTQESKKFTNSLAGIEKSATAAGLAVAGVAGTVATLAQVYASKMEKLYFASKKTGNTVSQMQALQYAGEQVGISAETMQGAIEGMSKALRGNPGLQGILKQLGVPTEGRTGAQQMLDLVQQLRQMPFNVAKGFAAMFGMDDDTFLVMAQNLDKIRELMKLREEMDRAAGVNAEENAAAMHEWQNGLRDLKAEFVTFEGVLAKSMIGPMRELKGVVHETLQDWTKLLSDPHGMDDFGARLREGLGLKPVGGGVKLAGQGGEVTPARVYEKIGDILGDKVHRAIVGFGHEPGYADKMLGPSPYGPQAGGGRGFVNPSLVTGPGGARGATDPQSLMAAIEERHGWPKGLLDSLWDQESSRGTNMVSKTGVVGHFQITGANRKRLGIRDPYNFEQELSGAEKMLVELFGQYGVLANVLAAWNGGTAAAKNLALGSDETKAFVPSVLNKIEQHNHFNISGSDAHSIGKEVGSQIKTNNSDVLRNQRSLLK